MPYRVWHKGHNQLLPVGKVESDGFMLGTSEQNPHVSLHVSVIPGAAHRSDMIGFAAQSQSFHSSNPFHSILNSTVES